MKLQKEKLTLEKIKKLLSENKPYLQEKYHIKTIGVFGSYVRGEQTEKSDIDILVEFEENIPVTFFSFMDLEFYLEDLIGKKIDLVMKTSLKPYIGKYILSEVQYL
jgi:predicted nucleotidyltransferase